MQSNNASSSLCAFFGLSGHVGGQESRVCKRCLLKASRIEMASRFIVLTALNQFLDVRDWGKMAQVCRIWRAGCDFLHTRWKALQRQIVLGKQITHIDRMLLRQNAPYLHQHPLLECRLYQTGLMRQSSKIDFSTCEIYPIAADGNDIQRPSLTCRQMKCRRPVCNSHPVNTLCQRLMYLPCSHSSFKHAIWSLQRQSSLVLQSLVPFLMWVGLRKPPVFKSIPASVHSACYWYCRAHTALKLHKHHFENTHTQHTEAFVCALLEFMRERQDADIEQTSFMERVVASQRPYLPYELTDGTGWRVERVLYETKRQLSSATRPFVVDVVVSRQENQRKTKTLMLKREQVDTDYIVMCCQRFLRSRGVHLKAYYVAPLQAQTKPYSITGSSSGAGYGLVLFDNGVTLKEVQDSYHNSIAEYVMLNNPNQVIKNVQTTFYRSCAAQSLLQLLFQTGDRHLQNILVSASGRMYHIDFGFLWSEPVLSSKMAQLGRQTIRMTPAMLGLIGQRWHRPFVDECKRVNRLIRQHIAAIFAIVWPLTQQVGTMDVETLQQNFEKYLCSSCVDSDKSQDLLIETLLKQSSQSASLGTVFGTACKIKDSVSALLGTSPVTAAGRVQKVVTSGVTAALAIRSLFGIP